MSKIRPSKTAFDTFDTFTLTLPTGLHPAGIFTGTFFMAWKYSIYGRRKIKTYEIMYRYL